MQISVILAIVFAIVGVAFALQNSVPVTVTLLAWQIDGSLAMVLLTTLALGALIVALVSTPAAIRARWIENRQRKEIETLKQSISGLSERMDELKRQLPVGLSSSEATADPEEANAIGLREIASQLGSPAQESARKG